MSLLHNTIASDKADAKHAAAAPLGNLRTANLPERDFSVLYLTRLQCKRISSFVRQDSGSFVELRLGSYGRGGSHLSKNDFHHRYDDPFLVADIGGELAKP